MYAFVQETRSVPLGIAAEKGHTQTVEKLLEGKANVDYQNEVRKTTSIVKAHHREYSVCSMSKLYSLVKQHSTVPPERVM